MDEFRNSSFVDILFDQTTSSVTSYDIAVDDDLDTFYKFIHRQWRTMLSPKSTK